MSETTLRRLSATARRRILVMGLPGAGKTTLATRLAARLNAVYFNADEVRAHINKDLGFSIEDRIEQARRMGWLCEQVARTGNYAIADFICPTPEARLAFGPAFTVWLARIEEGRFEDTNRLFVPPEEFDIKVTADGAAEAWAERIVFMLHPVLTRRHRPPCSLAGTSRSTTGTALSFSRGSAGSGRHASRYATHTGRTRRTPTFSSRSGLASRRPWPTSAGASSWSRFQT